MKRIYKYKLDRIGHQAHTMIDIHMPAKIMSATEQNNILPKDESGVLELNLENLDNTHVKKRQNVIVT